MDSVACLCGSRSAGAPSFRQLPLPASQRPAQILRCPDCDLYRTEPRPLADQSQAPDLYFSPEYFASAQTDAALWAQMPKPILDDIARFKTGGQLLDIGCGMGFLSHAARERGFEPTGIDLNPFAIDHGKRLFPELDLKKGDLALLPETPQFDVIVGNHVLEHLVDPAAFLNQLRLRLHDDGILVLGVPNILGGIPRLLRTLNRLPAGPGSRWLWFGYQLDQHLWHFSPRALSRFLAQNGWEILLLRKNENMVYGALNLPKFRYRALRWAWRALALARQGDNLRAVCRPKR